MKYNFPLATSTWGEEEVNAIHNIIDSGHYTMGDNVSEFEHMLARFVNSKYCVMVNSGSSANLLMVAALFYSKKYSLERGDEVVVPAVSWGTSYFPLQQFGLHLKFVDIDLQTLNYDLECLERVVTKKTKIILAVNLLGNPNNYIRVQEIADNYGAILIEDNCESMGAKFQGKYTGTFGVIGSFSTFFSHHISTMEGGAIVTDDDELYQVLRTLRAHGWTRDLPRFNHVCDYKSDNKFDESFRFVLPGYNVRPLEIEGAIGVEQLKKLPSFISVRRNNALLFKNIMYDHPDLMIQKEIGCSSWFGFSLIIKRKSNINRTDLIYLLESVGFECRPIVAGNFSSKEVMKYFDYDIPYKVKNAIHLDKYGLFIGNQHVAMDDAINKLKIAL